MGDVWAGDEVPITITLVNDLGEDFGIRQITTTCGCTAFDSGLDLIAAGASEELGIRFQAPSHAEEKTSRIRLIPLRESLRTLEITLVANVIEAASLSPEHLTFQSTDVLAQAASESRMVELSNMTDQSLRVTAITASPPGVFTVESNLSLIEAGDTESITITYDPPEVTGPVQGTLTVAIDHEGMPPLTASLRALVEGGVRIDPERIWFGRVVQGDTARGTLTVSNRRLEGFEVTDLEIDSPGVSAEISDVDNGETEITVTLNSGETPLGIVNTALTIHTNDPHDSELTIRVLGIVRP
jgi:hypothetical protein